MPNAQAIAARHAALNAGRPTGNVPRIEPTDLHKVMVNNSIRDVGAGYPYLASLMSSTSLTYNAVRTDAIPVAATDGESVYLNAQAGGWLDPMAYDDDERVFIHGHEVAHVFREDPWKMWHWKMQGWLPVPRLTTATPGIGNAEGRVPFDGKVANLAFDAIINATLIADRIGKCPSDAVLHPQVGPETDDATAVWLLWQQMGGQQGHDRRQEGQEGQGQGQGGQGRPGGQNPPGGGRMPGKGAPGNGEPREGSGSTQGDILEPGSMGDPRGTVDDTDPQDPATVMERLEQGMAERQVAVERAMAAAREAGTASSYMERMVKRARAPGIDWKSFFQGWLARAAGSSAYDWSRAYKPARDRHLIGQKGYFSPARGGHGINTMVHVGDVSGSISPAENQCTLATICEMAGDLNPRRVLVLWVDTIILRADLFEGCPTTEEIDSYYRQNPIPGGGGTSFVMPFALLDAMAQHDQGRIAALLGPKSPVWLAGEAADWGVPDGLVYVTDLCGPFPTEAPPRTHVLWVATTNRKHPWGERVTIDVKSLVKEAA